MTQVQLMMASLSSPTSLTAMETMAIGFAVFLLSLGAARKRGGKAERVAEKRSAEQVAQALAAVESLSDAEVARLLAAQGNAGQP